MPTAALAPGDSITDPGDPGYLYPTEYAVPDPPSIDPAMFGPYAVPDPPNIDGAIFSPYVVPDPPDIEFGNIDYKIPDPPDIDPAMFGPYVVPDPPEIEFGNVDYEIPDPPDTDDGAAPTYGTWLPSTDDAGPAVADGPALAQADFALTSLPTVMDALAAPAGDGGVPAAGSSGGGAPDKPQTFMVNRLSTDGTSLTAATIRVDGKEFKVVFDPSVYQDQGYVKVEISIGGTIATATIPITAVADVSVICERSKDPNKIADITFVGPAGTQIDVTSSSDVNVTNGSPAGPPTPTVPPIPVTPPEHQVPRPEAKTPEVKTPDVKTPDSSTPRPADPPPPAPAPAPAENPPAPVPGPDAPGLGGPVLDVPIPQVPGASTFDDLRPPQVPTDFEDRLAGNSPFNINVTFLPPGPQGQQGPQPKVESTPTGLAVIQPAPPSGLAQTQAVFNTVKVDPARVVPIRDGRTNQILGYHVQHGDTDWTLSRQGTVIGNSGTEKPTEEPLADPIDVVMLVIDLGPVGKKALSAGARLLFALGSVEKAAGERAARATIVTLGEQEVNELTRMWEKRLARATDPADTKRATEALTAIRRRGRVRSWQTSEDDVRYFATRAGGGGEVRLTYVDAAGTLRNTFPDATVGDTLIEIKNWEILGISSPNVARAQLRSLAEQIEARRLAAPGRAQIVVLDLRGQQLSERRLLNIGRIFAGQTGLPPSNIKLVVWGPR